MSYYTVLNGFKECFEADQFINTILEGDADELDLANKNLYGLAFIIIDGGELSDQLTTFNVTLQCVDIVTTTGENESDKFIGDNNEQDVYHTMHNVINRAFMKFRRDKLDLGIKVDDNASFQKIQDYENRVVGWELNLSVHVPDNIAVC